jgi:hypothetical protein
LSDHEPPNAPDASNQALLAALKRLLSPLATLAVSRGLPHAAVDELLRQTFVQAAFDAHPDLAAHRRSSRVSAATGLHRREVQRLLAAPDQPHKASRSVSAEVFTRWRGDKAYQAADGTPCALPRIGPAPSFEHLAQSITRDVHTRTVLEELLRLQVVAWDEASDTVTLRRDGFVPSQDAARMAAFLADNAGDHVQAAVDNMLQGGRRHFEQAIYADGLSAASVAEFKALVDVQWRGLLGAMVPALQAMVERDERATSDASKHRVRLGLYAFDAVDPPLATAPPAPATTPKRKQSLRTTRPTTTKASAPRVSAKAVKGKP